MFQKILKQNQNQYLAKTWQRTLREREIMRNNYRTSRNIKEAKAFVNSIIDYSPHTHFAEHGEHIIFSYKKSASLDPAYTFTTKFYIPTY